MTSKMHWVYQALLALLQVTNLATSVVPPKYQAVAAAGLAAVQGALGLYNHYFTPDGTKLVQ